ncbi:uncharacterized protein LOC100370997 [Saccoglossus kowalevskii]
MERWEMMAYQVIVDSVDRRVSRGVKVEEVIAVERVKKVSLGSKALQDSSGIGGQWEHEEYRDQKVNQELRRCKVNPVKLVHMESQDYRGCEVNLVRKETKALLVARDIKDSLVCLDPLERLEYRVMLASLELLVFLVQQACQVLMEFQENKENSVHGDCRV